jgi:hypothetical protein
LILFATKKSDQAGAWRNTSLGATDTYKAAQQLAQRSAQLRTLIEQFKISTIDDIGAIRSDGTNSQAIAARGGS